MNPTGNMTRAVRIRLAAFAVVIVALAGTAYFALREPPAPAGPMVCATDDTSRTSPGFRRAADDAALHTLDGRSVMLHALSGARFTVLIFCSSHCPCSDGYVDRLARLRRTYESSGVAFAAVQSNADDSAEDMKAYIRRRKYPLDVYRDADRAVADMLGARVTPEAFVFDSAWRLQYQGRIDDDKSGRAVREHSLRAVLDTLLSGGSIITRVKPALGCAIVRTVPR